MAPIASFNRQSSFMGTEIDSFIFKKLGSSSSRIAHLDPEKQLSSERSAVVEFVKAQWENVVKRDHYTMNEDGIRILIEARPPSTHLVTSNGNRKTILPIKIDSSRAVSHFDHQPATASVATQKLVPIAVNRVDKSSLSLLDKQQPSSSLSAHKVAASKPPIKNKLDTSSLYRHFDFSKSGRDNNKVASSRPINIHKLDDDRLVTKFQPQVTAVEISDSNVNTYSSSCGSNKQQPTIVTSDKDLLLIGGTAKPKKRFMEDTISSAAKYRKKASVDGVRSGFNMSKNKSSRPTAFSVVKNRNYNHVQSRYNKQNSIVVTHRPLIIYDWNQVPDCTTPPPPPPLEIKEPISISQMNYDDWNNCCAWNVDPISYNTTASPNIDIWDEWDCTAPESTVSNPPIGNRQKQNDNNSTMQWHSFDYSLMPVAMGDKDSFLSKYAECPDEPLGEGQFGSVIKGIRLCDQLPVAIKRMKKSSIGDWVYLTNGVQVPLEYCILNEVRTCKSAIHLNDAFDMGDDYTIVTDLIEGSCTLLQFILDMTPLDGPTLQLAFRKLIEALQQCHEAGVYHCDIKETNILIHPATKVSTLIDFGLAALAVDSPYWGSCGTEGYQAPEIVANLEKWDGKTADIFALGVVLKNMYNSSVFATTQHHPTDRLINESKSSIDLAPSQCLELIQAMQETRPSDRPSIDQILQHPWLMMNAEQHQC